MSENWIERFKELRITESIDRERMAFIHNCISFLAENNYMITHLLHESESD
jgi:hypothetical protein